MAEHDKSKSLMFPRCSRDECKKDWTPVDLGAEGDMMGTAFMAPCGDCRKRPRARKLVVSCIPCNKRVELPIDDVKLTFHRAGGSRGHITLDEFIAYPHVLCIDCMGAASIEVIDG